MLVSVAQRADGTPAHTVGLQSFSRKKKRKRNQAGTSKHWIQERRVKMFIFFFVSLFFYPPPVFWFPLSASVLISSVEKSETDKQAVTRLDTTPDGLWLKLFGLNLLWHFTTRQGCDSDGSENGCADPSGLQPIHQTSNKSTLVWTRPVLWCCIGARVIRPAVQHRLAIKNMPTHISGRIVSRSSFYSCWITICFVVVFMSDTLSKSLIYCSTLWIVFPCFTKDNCNVKTLLI